MEKQALIIANGSQRSLEIINRHSENRRVIALDGAYNQLSNESIIIDTIVGDLDSISPEACLKAKQLGVKIIHVASQDHTDLDKAIQHLDQQHFSDIIILSATGQRMDHTLHNLQLLSRYYQPHRPIKIITETETITLVKDETITLTGKSGTGIGIIGAPKGIVSSQGLMYDMDKLTLEFGYRDSTSNCLKNHNAKLTVNGQVLLTQHLQ